MIEASLGTTMSYKCVYILYTEQLLWWIIIYEENHGMLINREWYNYYVQTHCQKLPCDAEHTLIN